MKQWLAFGSNESGNLEVYVQTFPEAAGKHRVSRNGGAWSVWNDDGTAIYYLEAGHRVVMVPFAPGAEPELGPPATLFETPVTGHYILRNFDILNNGESFLVTRPVEEERQTITVVLDWQAELR